MSLVLLIALVSSGSVEQCPAPGPEVSVFWQLPIVPLAVTVDRRGKVTLSATAGIQTPYFAAISGTVTDEMIREYIDSQQGEGIADDSRFPIDDT